MTSDFLSTSGNMHCDRRYDYALGLSERGEIDAALELLQQSLELTPDWPVLPFTIGTLYMELGQNQHAIDAFKDALRLDPADHQGALLKLQLLGESVIEGSLPPAFVETLFDQYAPRFDEHLLTALDYNVPRRILELYEGLRPQEQSHLRILDLGCGTGLAGEYFVKKAAWLEGVDISSGMLALAKNKGVYNALTHKDLYTYLYESQEHYDLILAADVLIYMGEMAPVFEILRARLKAGGLFLFSLQKLEDDGAFDYVLEETQRFSHSRAYIQRIIAENGLSLIALEETVLRKDRDEDVMGYIIAVENVKMLDETLFPPALKTSRPFTPDEPPVN